MLKLEKLHKTDKVCFYGRKIIHLLGFAKHFVQLNKMLYTNSTMKILKNNKTYLIKIPNKKRTGKVEEKSIKSKRNAFNRQFL